MRRRRRGFAGTLILVLILAALIGAALLRFVFVVRNVQVLGNADVISRNDLVRVAGIRFGGSILRIDREDVETRINATGLIRLEDMIIQYPSTVCLRVSPRTPEAMVLHMGKIRILDDEACVIESLDEVPDKDLIYISGMRTLAWSPGEPIQAEEGQTEAYCAVIQALNVHGADMYVSELKVEDIERLRLITRTGITVELGDSERMSDKIAWMKSAVSDLEQRGEGGGVLDVSSSTKADYRAGTAAQ